MRNYSELEQLLSEKGNGATLREAVTFYLVHHPHKKFRAQTVAECSDKFIQHQRVRHFSPIQLKTLEKHFRRFKAQFAGQARVAMKPPVSQEDLSGRLARKGITMTQTSISKLENRERAVLDYEAQALAKILKVGIAWLYGEE